MGFVEDSIRKVWVGTNVSANSWRFMCMFKSQEDKWSFSAVVIRLASTHRDGRGAVASDDDNKENWLHYTHTRSHAGACSRYTNDRGPRDFSDMIS